MTVELVQLVAARSACGRTTRCPRLRGHLGPKMLRAFTALAAQQEGGDTLLSGCLPDQAALYGVIAKLEALGLELIEVRYRPR